MFPDVNGIGRSLNVWLVIIINFQLGTSDFEGQCSIHNLGMTDTLPIMYSTSNICVFPPLRYNKYLIFNYSENRMKMAAFSDWRSNEAIETPSQCSMLIIHCPMLIYHCHCKGLHWTKYADRDFCISENCGVYIYNSHVFQLFVSLKNNIIRIVWGFRHLFFAKRRQFSFGLYYLQTNIMHHYLSMVTILWFQLIIMRGFFSLIFTLFLFWLPHPCI